jgi:hypothetical protein
MKEPLVTWEKAVHTLLRIDLSTSPSIQHPKCSSIVSCIISFHTSRIRSGTLLPFQTQTQTRNPMFHHINASTTCSCGLDPGFLTYSIATCVDQSGSSMCRWLFRQIYRTVTVTLNLVFVLTWAWGWRECQCHCQTESWHLKLET